MTGPRFQPGTFGIDVWKVMVTTGCWASVIHVYCQLHSRLLPITFTSTSNYIHVYFQLHSCLLPITFTSTANYIHVYCQLHSRLLPITFTSTSNYISQRTNIWN